MLGDHLAFTYKDLTDIGRRLKPPNETATDSFQQLDDESRRPQKSGVNEAKLQRRREYSARNVAFYQADDLVSSNHWDTYGEMCEENLAMLDKMLPESHIDDTDLFRAITMFARNKWIPTEEGLYQESSPVLRDHPSLANFIPVEQDAKGSTAPSGRQLEAQGKPHPKRSTGQADYSRGIKTVPVWEKSSEQRRSTAVKLVESYQKLFLLDAGVAMELSNKFANELRDRAQALKDGSAQEAGPAFAATEKRILADED
ncbi:MAG: hypothetical protein MMC33_005795 [Icmadophila ericetorum]|nr:hypothetical protein [Icmadophila ericetorum]